MNDFNPEDFLVKEQDPAELMADIAELNAAINFALHQDTDEGLEYLRVWREGDWEACREWPGAPTSRHDIYEHYENGYLKPRSESDYKTDDEINF